MSPANAYLLRGLMPAVNPAPVRESALARGAAGAGNESGIDFDGLLERALAGEVTSGRLVDGDADALAALTDEQRVGLARAADAAEASGARTALMIIEGRGLVMDVAERRVTDAAGAGGLRRLSVDVVFDVGRVIDAPASPRGPIDGPIPAGIQRQLLGSASSQSSTSALPARM